MSDQGSTQSIDRLFCELAHVTRAKNYLQQAAEFYGKEV